MYSDVIKKINHSAKIKEELFLKHKAAYIINGMLAGAYIGLGIVLIVVIGGSLFQTYPSFVPIVMGVSFGIALALVMMAGADLFTGNTMVLPLSVFCGKMRMQVAIRMLIVNYAANFLGSIIFAAIVYYSGIFKSEQFSDFLIYMAHKKSHLDPISLFFRGVLCNWLVALSVWCCYRLQSESAKILMIFCCLFGFITPGYEHSVANMTLLSLAEFFNTTGINLWSDILYNLTFVSLGNIFSGTFLVAGSYFLISKNTKSLNSAVE